MSDELKNQFLWDHHENALTFLTYIVEKSITYHEDRLHDFFLKTRCFVICNPYYDLFLVTGKFLEHIWS